MTQSLPRSLDVNVQVSAPQTELATALNLAVCVVKDGPLTHGNGRIRFYNNADDVIRDFGDNTEAAKAARDFTAQSPRPTQFAIAQYFSTPQHGTMTTGESGPLTEFQKIADGTMRITLDGVTATLQSLDFTRASSDYSIAQITQTALQASFEDSQVTYSNGHFIFTSGTTGDGSTVSALSGPTGSGTDISGANYFNGQTDAATCLAGYTPAGMVSEVQRIADAAHAQQRTLYAWTFDEALRDDPGNMIVLANYFETQTALLIPCSNDPYALNPDASMDIGPTLARQGYRRCVDPLYHDNPDYYPDFALAAVMLSVNYNGENSAITAKFKNLIGIPTVNLSTNQWSTLQGKGYNSFTLTGNSSRVFREGTNVAAGWYIDDQINLDNFAEQLQVAAYNAFLRNGKIPYTPQGQSLIEDALVPVCEQFVTNGTLADRQEVDLSAKSGTVTQPAYTIVSGNIAQASASDRAARIAPPITLTCYLAGAIHHIDITVNVYN